METEIKLEPEVMKKLIKRGIQNGADAGLFGAHQSAKACEKIKADGVKISTTQQVRGLSIEDENKTKFLIHLIDGVNGKPGYWGFWKVDINHNGDIRSVPDVKYTWAGYCSHQFAMENG